MQSNERDAKWANKLWPLKLPGKKGPGNKANETKAGSQMELQFKSVSSHYTTGKQIRQ
jgi:hypothetical protein